MVRACWQQRQEAALRKSHRSHERAGWVGCIMAHILRPMLIVVAVVLQGVRAEPYPSRIRFADAYAGFFAGQAAVVNVLVAGEHPDGTHLGWRLSAESSSVARGEVMVRRDGPTPVSFDLPPVKPGVVMSWTLQVVLGETSIERMIKAYPFDPFEGRTSRLITQPLSLFDPVGQTAVILDSSRIPYRRLHRPDDLLHADGLIVVGEGVSFHEYRGLAEAMIECAINGNRVLCLAPSEGEFILPGTRSQGGVPPDAMIFRREEAIREIDKRLDTALWAPGIPSVVSSIEVDSFRQSVMARVLPGQSGWAWVEMCYGDQGRLVVGGFGIIRHWDQSPCARWLLAGLLEQMLSGNPSRKQGGGSHETY